MHPVSIARQLAGYAAHVRSVRSRRASLGIPLLGGALMAGLSVGGVLAAGLRALQT